MGVLERNQLSATMDMIHGSARIYDQFMIFANISIPSQYLSVVLPDGFTACFVLTWTMRADKRNLLRYSGMGTSTSTSTTLPTVFASVL